MQTYWIVVADCKKARIFEKKGLNSLHEFEDLFHPAFYESQNELERHQPDKYFKTDRTYSSHTENPSDQLIYQDELFAKSIALYLEKGRQDSKYHHLYLISSPRFLGMLRKKLGKEINRLIENEWPQELPDMSVEQIENFLKKKV